MQKYDPKKIEKKWQAYWEANKTFEVAEMSEKQKFYSLIEFPYPSAEGLHVGHPRPFTAMDVVSRKKRMEGFNVLYPIGFDAFGLPTENFAIKTGKPPAEVTKKNIANFTRQLKALGYSFAWDRMVDTTDPKYYKWTQWIFLQFFKHGLAYKKNQPINWCPKDKTGLANEEVVNGCCERCGTPVEQRDKAQWMLAITKYADKLLAGLKTVDYITPARVQQENWIGRSDGAEVEFRIKNEEFRIKVFTTRPDTLFGATYMVLAPEHPLISNIEYRISNIDEVKKYIEQVKKKNDTERTAEGKEKTGVELKSIKAINPVNGEEIPIWIADYVLATYGTGAIMAVPAHDERDFEFAKKFGLPIKYAVAKYFKTTEGKDALRSEMPTKRRPTIYALVKHWSEDKYLCLDWEKFGWHSGIIGGIKEGEDTAGAAIREIREETGYKNIKVVKETSGEIHSHYFAAHKNENRYAVGRGILAQLENGEQGAVKNLDTANHKTVWITAAEMKNFLNLNVFQYLWDELNSGETAITGEGVAINSDFLNGLTTAEAKEKIIQWLEEKDFGKRQVNYKLRDWVFSRQRYWGEPIPLVFCENCAQQEIKKARNQENSDVELLNSGWIPLPESELPLQLPKVEKYQPTDTGESPLSAITKWVNTKCPKCGGPAKRETDTMPNWAGSSWYFLRYCDPNNDKEFASSEKLKYWTPVDWYNGGMEHTVLHLLYSRFWNQFLFDLGLVPTSEPYKKRTSHGMILGPDGEKMSKSRGNVINPDEMVEKFGADAFRGYIMFMGPFDQAVMWDTNGLVGVRRFLDKVWALQNKVTSTDSPNDELRMTNDESNSKSKIINQKSKIEAMLHQTIKKVGDDIEAMRFNTAIAKMMELTNEMTKESRISNIEYRILIQLLAPFAPHLAEELWEKFGDGKLLAYSAWPKYDPELAKSGTMTIAIQVNGKVRDEVTVSPDISEDEIKKLALASEKVKKWLESKQPKKVIYVKGRLISIVV